MAHSSQGVSTASQQPTELPGQPLKAIRLVCLDVDGTLLDSELQLRENVRLALHRADQAGIAIAIVTGRNLDSTRPILDALGLEVSVISCSGAHITTTDGRTQEISLSPGEADFVVRLALRVDAGLFVDRPGRSWALGNKELVRRYAGVSTNVHTTDVPRALRPPPLKISIIHDTAVLASLRQKISQRYPDLQLASPFETVLDVTPHQATKGIALRSLGAMIGVPLEQVAALGDSENDVSIFQESGLSIAMANSPAEIRSVADWIAPSNDDEGVAWAIGRILSSNQTVSAP